ncbi:hypothetical protein AB0B30_27440 [Streptomyces narbonensis]|uniref:Integral membrane protein n=1 Tax=Streptomyces narbonensis TaxID=67333 RepID=A0ABV3CDL1_9ACTN
MSDHPRPRAAQQHRCAPLHTVYGLVALLAGCGLLMEQPLMWLFVVPLAVLVVQTRGLAQRRARNALRRRDERKAAASARRAWGAVAAALDAALVTCAFAVCTVLLSGHGDLLVLRGRAADYLALAAGTTFAGLHSLAHCMSARAPKTPQPDA